MIRFQNISKVYYPSGIIALEDINFEVKPKEFVSIVGRSGAGKTTLIRLLLAEEKPTKGRIFFEDQDVHKVKKSDLPCLRRKIGVVFQDYKLLPYKTAWENIAYALETVGMEEEIIKRDVAQVLELVGLTNRAENYPSELSGGEKQRIAIARALVHRPLAIIADEPTGNLDPYHSSDIMSLLLKINDLGTTVVLSTHDKEIINSLKRRVITLEKGKIIRDEEEGRFII